MTDTFTGLSSSKILAQEGEKGKVWDVCPFQLVSLLDMIPFLTAEFYFRLKELDWLEASTRQGEPDELMGGANSPYFKLMSDGLKEEWHELLNKLEAECKRLEFDYSLDHIRVIRNWLAADAPNIDVMCPHLRVADHAKDLRKSIDYELKTRTFMFMPPAEAKYYEQEELFGPEVKAKFPKANKEITTAGNCYATGNYTACVFHLMRAVECGARKMVFALKVRGQLGRPVELCDWGDLTKALDEGVKALSVGSRTKMYKKATFEFYNHAVAQFRNFKDAWRNNVSHTRKTYQAGVTKDILDNTRQFMQHLATRLKE